MVKPHLMEDKDLVSLYQSGDQSAITELINRYKQRIYTAIFFLVKDRELAEDLFQDTFIKIITSLRNKAYNEQGKFLPWALRISHNLVIDHFRKEKLMPLQHDKEDFSMFDVLPHNDRNPEERIMQDEKIKLVHSLLDRLPADQREVVILRHYGGLSFKEISKMLEININTALGRMHYAILKMREMMNEHQVKLKE